MNKSIIKEALKAGITLETNNLRNNKKKINLNLFIDEVSKLRFSLQLPDAVRVCRDKFFKSTFVQGN